MPEALVLCGAARGRPRGREQVVSVDLGGNVTLRLEDIRRRMLAEIPDVLTDLVEIATYVFCADQLVTRGGEAGQALGSSWRRRLRFRIPVRCPELWASDEIREALEALLGFLSDDEYTFDFEPAMTSTSLNAYLEFSSEDAFPVDDVLLFSGGLDSFAGAVDYLQRGARVVLVSHQSAPKVAERQKYLARELHSRFPHHLIHVPVRITKRQSQTVETTQRTRSFLFAALAVTVGNMVRCSSVRFHENGVVSFNLPIAGQVVGARASRSTHPKVLAELSWLLSALLGSRVAIDNPFVWKSKGEVLAELGSSSCRDLVPLTVSCSHVHGMTKLHSHCGRCSQCLERRFAALAAGLGDVDPAEMYAVDLLTGPRDDGQDRAMAESYIRHARELSLVSDRMFAARFAGHVARAATGFSDLSADGVMAAALALHRRHGEAIVGVLEAGFKHHAKALADGGLPSDCLLRIAAGDETQAIILRNPAGSEESFELDQRDFRRTSEIRLARDEARKRLLIEGIGALGGAGTFALISRLVQAFQADIAAGRSPDRYRFVKSRELERDLGLSGPTLRRQITRFRKRVAETFQTRAGLTLLGDAIIQSEKWQGYRINPSVRIVAVDQLDSPGKGHETEREGSRLAGQNRRNVPF